jgi:hypothetical protein
MFDAKVVEVLIASPGGLETERKIVREVVAEWNAIHARERQILLLARGWETDAGAELAGRPQGIINERILDHADIVVGIFWTRIGSPTGEEVSGTVEEIKRHHAAGRPVVLHFSNKPAMPGYDPDQYASLLKFKAWALSQGLVGDFASDEEFKGKFSRDLQLVIRDNPYIKSLTDFDLVSLFDQGLKNDPPPELSSEARELAIKASQQDDPLILTMRTMDGLHISAGGQVFGNGGARESARWEAAVRELYELGLTDDINGKQQIFRLNHAGFTLVESLGEISA